MSLEQDLLKSEMDLWTGGPEAYEKHCDDQCLVVFADFAGVMARADIAKSAEAGRWHDVAFTPKGLVQPGEDWAVVAYECQAKRKDGQP